MRRIVTNMKKKKKRQLHTDGTVCLEGTRRVPKAFAPCCDQFKYRTTACDSDIRYEWWSKRKIWVTKISDIAGGGGVVMSYCPHCGRKLKGLKESGRVIEL